MRYLTRYLSEEEKMMVLKQIVQSGIKGSIHDTIRLPLPLKGNDLSVLPDRLQRKSVPKWPITPFREVCNKLIQKGYSDLEFHSRVTPFPVDPGTEDRDYLIGPMTEEAAADDNEENPDSLWSECENIALRKLSYQKEISGDLIPYGYTEAPPYKDKVWDVLYIPEETAEMREMEEKPSPVLVRGINRDGMLQIFKRSEAFYVLDKNAGDVKGFSLKDLEEKMENSSVSTSSKPRFESFLDPKEADEAYKSYTEGFGIPPEEKKVISFEERRQYLKLAKKQHKKLFRSLRELAIRAIEGKELTADELRLLYDNKILVIPRRTSDVSPDSVAILLSNMLSQDGISDSDLRTLYNQGFLGVKSQESEPNEKTKLVTMAINGEGLTDEQLRNLYDEGYLGLLPKAEKAIDCHIRNWYREALKNKIMTDDELLHLYKEGIFEVQLWKLDKPHKKRSAFIDSLSHDDVHLLSESGLRTLPESLVEKFLLTEMKALGPEVLKRGKVTENLLRRMFHNGFVPTPEKLTQRLLQDGYKGCNPDGTRLTDLARKTLEKEDEKGKTLPPLTHEVRLCALTHAIMKSKSLTGRNLLTSAGANPEDIIKQYSVGRTRYFRGPHLGISGGSGRGTTYRQFQRATAEPTSAGFRRCKPPPSATSGGRQRNKQYCLACVMNYQTSSDKNPPTHLEGLGKSSEMKREGDYIHQIHAHDSDRPTSITIVLSDKAEGLASEQPVHMKSPLFIGRTMDESHDSKAKQKPRTVGDLVPQDVWQVDPSSEKLGEHGKILYTKDTQRHKLKEFYSCQTFEGPESISLEDEKLIGIKKKYWEHNDAGEDSYPSSLLSGTKLSGGRGIIDISLQTDSSKDAAKKTQRDGSVHELRSMDDSFEISPSKALKQRAIAEELRKNSRTLKERMLSDELRKTSSPGRRSRMDSLEEGIMLIDGGRTVKGPVHADKIGAESTFTEADQKSTFESRVMTTSSDHRCKPEPVVTHRKKIVRDEKVIPKRQMKKGRERSSKVYHERNLAPVGVRIVGKKASSTDTKKMKKLHHYPKGPRRAALSRLLIEPKIQKKIITDRISSVLSEGILQEKKTYRPADVAEIDMSGMEFPDELEMKEMLEDAGLLMIENGGSLMDEMVEEALKLGDQREVEEEAAILERIKTPQPEVKKPEPKRTEMRRHSTLFDEDLLLPFGRPTGGITSGKMPAYYGLTLTRSKSIESRLSLEDHREVMQEIKNSILETHDQKKNYMSILQTDAENAPWFEFPVNLNELNDMHPRVYMKKYCIINPRRQPIYARIFHRFCENDKMVTKLKLLRAINELLIGNYTLQQLEKIMQLLQCSHQQKVDKDLFLSLVCLAERLADKDLEAEFPPPRNYLAELDESVVLSHLEKLEVNRPLYNLLRAIIDD